MEAQPGGWRATFLGTLAGLLRFRGRTTRTEVVIYGASVMIAAMILGFIAGFVLTFDAAALFKDALMALALLAVPALFARRFHDSGKSAVWAWLLLPGVALWIVRSAIAVQAGTDSRISFDRWTWPIDWLSILANMALLVLLILPGTIGPNRFGEDPRGRIAKSSGGELEPPAAI